ncbi:M16 family metallopeptidase [Pararhodonellum marinum]|uniref:M16 family metallopeptidase n=1 Tax=Pararhodonellum marinum TaxID=2755358 RepID=UPI001E58FB0B|nr:M16 family metallopeptidase [Pararhodonellum marinum]
MDITAHSFANWNNAPKLEASKIAHAVKKYFTLFLLLSLYHPFIVFGQFALDDPLPIDDRVKIGQLANGLVYYLQHNPKPENKLELRLVINAGSVLEDEDQLGLAHFTEHMAFNGSTHFEKNELISYLQSIGVKFGSDLNAYTSFDETVYKLPIPIENPEKIETGFLVLRDWAAGVSMLAEDIDAERDIIVEEWRTGQGTDQRMRDEYLPQLFYQSQYAERLPIGDMDLIRNFDHESLRRFYREWYRPDNMAIVAIGNVSVEDLEDMVVQNFAELENPEQPRERKEFPFPTHQKTLVSIVTDLESPGIQVQVYYKHKPIKDHSVKSYRDRLIRTMYGGMLTQRLDDLRQKPDAPFIYAGARYGNFVRTLDYYTTFGAVSTQNTMDALRSLLVENERVLQHGFSSSELERVQRALLNSAERGFKEMEKTESQSLVSRYVSHFLNGTFAGGEKYRHLLYEQLIPDIQLEEINQLGKELVTEENRVVIITAPESEKPFLPSENEILALMDQVKEISLEPFTDKLLDDVLMHHWPAAGKVQESRFHDEIEVTSITFENGLTIHLKPTDFKNDEIVFSGSAKGGASIYPDEDHFSASYAGVMVNVMGTGNYSPSDIRKILVGKNVFVTPNIGLYEQNISGSTSPENLEMALQLIHLYFTAPRKDEELFEVYLSNSKSQMESALSNPDYQFSMALNQIISQDHVRGKGIYDPKKLELIDIDRGLEIYRERFSNAADFVFNFTGNIDLESAIPLFERYLGSLPGDPTQKAAFKDLGIRPPVGLTENILVGTDEKSQVILLFTGDEDYDINKVQPISFLGEILTIKLIESLREEIGGVYGVGASGGLSTVPSHRFSFSVSFPCSPENVDKLIAAAWAEIHKIQENGPTEADLAKVRESKRIALEENLKRNQFWNAQLSAAVSNERPLETLLSARERIDAVTTESIQEAAKNLLIPENLLEIRRFPAHWELSEE